MRNDQRVGQRGRESNTLWEPGNSGGCGVFLVVDRDGFQVFSLEHLVTVEAAEVVDAIATCHNLGSLVVAE